MNKRGFKIIPIWGLAIVSSILCTIFLAWWAQKAINSLNNAVPPCLHGGTYNSSSESCDCSNSNGLFGGTFCEESQCNNFGVIFKHSKIITDDMLSIYGCRCPRGPEKRWTGLLCDKCYADNSNSDCTGECNGESIAPNAVVAEGINGQCDKVCLPDGGIIECNAVDIGYNGVCNACNGHGKCDNNAECICDNGWFDSDEGVKCVKSCDGQCGKNADCKIVNGEPKCFCKQGFWNEPECDILCPGLDPVTFSGTECSGHGSCYYDGGYQNISVNNETYKYAWCTCDATYTAENSPDCAYECPHRPTVEEPCSGHGTCSIENGQAICNCDNDWFGERCDCNQKYTCFGHGECNKVTGECECFSGKLQADKDTSINVIIHSKIEGAQDTFRFNSNAHYIELNSDIYELSEGMILNVSDMTKEMPITIKTVLLNDTVQWAEIDETQSSALYTFFNLQGLGPFTNFALKFEFNWDPSSSPRYGFYKGPRCLECQNNWFPPPKMGETKPSCNVYCNPDSEYKWYTENDNVYPFSGNDGFGCWGRGQCVYQETEPTCKCNPGTDPETNCAQCAQNKYPKLQWLTNPVEEFCSVECVESTCNGHGVCNPLAFKTPDDPLCLCDLNDYNMDTYNATSRCSECNRNWFPKDLNAKGACSDFCSDDVQDSLYSGCDGLIKTYSDTKEDITITTNNLQGQEVDIVQRIDAPEKARVINCLNCQQGTCSKDGTCTCPEGVTGAECQNACIVNNNQVCSGHGQCGQNELFLYFDPNSDLTQCECNPQDQYTDETRDYYQRLGVTLDPKPSKNYYGSACEYHCPTYNEEICAERGECHPVPVEGSYRCKTKTDKTCQEAMSGQNLDGVFCAVTTSPWDVKAKDIYKASSYFNTPSPGSIQCTNSQCKRNIEEKDWSQYCVSMLKGLYPEQLNTPSCAHNKDKDSECAGLNGHIKCSTALEDVFSRAKTCSMFDVYGETIQVYDAWDVNQMGVTAVIINVKENSKFERDMIPFLYHVKSVNGTHYKESEINQTLRMKIGDNNTLILYDIGCGDSYGLEIKNNHLTYTQDYCKNTNCNEQINSTNPWHSVPMNISNQHGCCKCSSTRSPLLDKAFDITNTDVTIHTIQLYHDKTWCEMSEHIFEDSGALNEQCSGDIGKASTFENTEKICHSHNDKVSCTMDSNCVYDISVPFQKEIKSKCNTHNGKATLCDETPQCIYNTNTGKCSPKTFCRIKTCEDTIKDVGISPFCTDISIPDWCPAVPSVVNVTFKPYVGEGTQLKNVMKNDLQEQTVQACANRVAEMGKKLFEFDNGCFVYEKIYDLQTKTSTVTSYTVSDFNEASLQKYKKQWEDQCFALTSKIVDVSKSGFSPDQLFYMCWNLNEKNYPFVMSSTGSSRGGIKLLHENKFRAFVDSVSNMKQDERFNINDFPISDEIQVNSAWCKNHIESRYPTGDLNSFAEATKYARPSSFTKPNFASICSSSISSGDLNMGYNFDEVSASKTTLFWENVFKRQYGKEWDCSTRDKNSVGSWNAGALYYISCYNFDKNTWVQQAEFDINEPNERFDYFSKLTPRELDSCIIIPNADALVWKTPEYNVISRTQANCLNVDNTMKHILNNAIAHQTFKDSKISTPEAQSDAFNDIQANPPLNYPELLYRSRLRSMYSEVFYVHKPGTCSGDCKLHTKEPYNLPDTYFKNKSQTMEWCDNYVECDGFTITDSGIWYPWAFIGASYEYEETLGHESYIKSTSITDTCDQFKSTQMFQVKQSEAFEYGIPKVSQTVVPQNGVLEFTNKQTGALHMDGWSYALELQRSSRFYVTGSNLPNNALLVQYTKVKSSFDTQSFPSREAAELACFSNNMCAGVIYPSDTYDSHGFGTGTVYITMQDNVVPDKDGNAYFAPNLFKFLIIGNNIHATEMLDRPYDVNVVWPLVNNYGEVNIQLWKQDNDVWGWVPNKPKHSWEKGQTFLTDKGLIEILSVKSIAFTDIPAERFANSESARQYSMNVYNINASYANSDGTFSPGEYETAWRKNIHVSSVNVFKVNALLSITLLENANYGKVKTTKKHIKRNDEVVQIEPITVCLENPRKVGATRIVNETETCSVVWDYFSDQTSACKFKSTYYVNGTINISPDGISIDDSYLFGRIVPDTKNSGTWTRIKRNDIEESSTVLLGGKAVIASTTTIKNIPTISFDSTGSVSLSFTRNGVETFDLTIVDDFAYINRNFNLSVPKTSLGWSIMYRDNEVFVNGFTGTVLQGNVVPDTVNIWNGISNSSSKIFNLKWNGHAMGDLSDVDGVWSTKKSMHPGVTYSLILNNDAEYEEEIDMKVDTEWQKGSWVKGTETMSVSMTFVEDTKNKCIEFARSYYWQGKGPVQYVGVNGNTCTIYWDTILSRTSSTDGWTALLPKEQFHVSGWFFVEASTIATRTLEVQDKSNNPLFTLQMRGGRVLQNGYPTKTIVKEDQWHYWSLDISRVTPVRKTIQMQIADKDGGFVENINDNFFAYYNTTSNKLIISPILVVDSFHLGNTKWYNDGVNIPNNISFFKSPMNTENFEDGLENVKLNITSYDYQTIIELDDDVYQVNTFNAITSSIDGGHIKMSNSGQDNTDFRMENVKVRNRRAASICNVKDMLFRSMDEIALQECSYSQKCYDDFNNVNKFKVCNNNERYMVPPEIEGDDARLLASELDWVAYCDYAFPHSLDSLDTDEMCEGLWFSASINDQEPDSYEKVTKIKDVVGVLYRRCDKTECENITSGFLSHNRCDNICREAYFMYIDANDEEKPILIYNGTDLATINILNWQKIRCNSDYDHIGIHTGDWVPECRQMSDVVPDIRKPTETYTVPNCTTYPFDDDFYTSCFSKTIQYTTACSSTCINRLRIEIGNDDCKKVENLRNIYRLAGNECSSNGCQQELDTMIPKQFCSYQRQYHDIQPYEINTRHTLHIPDLQNTACSDQCVRHLENSLDYEDWESWCMDYASGEVLGFCSRTDCQCEAGYDGTQCEMKCPMGSSDGEDATCSGTNGFCIPKDSSDIFEDRSRQELAGEYDSSGVTNYPPWQSGPSTVQGICECTVGSGDACEIQCANTNNGTHGPKHLNQYGICDTYLAIAKPLPPCSRYNSWALTDYGQMVSPNSTTYDGARILHPERLFFCSNQDMIDGAAKSAYENANILDEIQYSDFVVSEVNEELYSTVIFQRICFPYPTENLYQFTVIEEVNKKYFEKPIYEPKEWAFETNKSVSIDIEQLWFDSISRSWIEGRLYNSTGYFEPYIKFISTSDLYVCALETMKYYEQTKGMFYMDDTNCYLQDSIKALSKEEWISGISPVHSNYTRRRGIVHTAYYIDVSEVPRNVRALNVPRKTKHHGLLSNTGLYLSNNKTLWIEENPFGSSSIEVLMEDNGISSHVIVDGDIPYNRKVPGLVYLQNNKALMFGGRLTFAENEVEDSNELFIIDMEHFKYADQSFVMVSFTLKETDFTPESRANPIMAFDGDSTVYMFGGSYITYNAQSIPISQKTSASVWKLDINAWSWSVVSSLDYGHYNPLGMVRIEAWVEGNSIITKDFECDSKCVSKPTTCDTCVEELALQSVEFDCTVDIIKNNEWNYEIHFAKQQIGYWNIEPNDFKSINKFQMWYYDWKTSTHGIQNIFQIEISQSGGFKVNESIPRLPNYIENGTYVDLPNKTSGISIDECRYKCYTKQCEAFGYNETSGSCVIGSGQYKSDKYNSIVKTDGYNTTFLESYILEDVTRYYKRAIMMQGKYSVLNELGIGQITDVWKGYDWIVHRELGPSKFTSVPDSDGSRNIQMTCTTLNCMRHAAVAFEKAKYTEKEASALCSSMYKCLAPCFGLDGKCEVLSTFTQPQMYYMIDFSAPELDQEEHYQLIQGRHAYNIKLIWKYDEDKNFDSNSMNPYGRPLIIENNIITINISNSYGIGGVRFLWTIENNVGWLYKSRQPFNHYLVDQSIADRTLHRGGTCGESASETCPGSKTYYNVPCNGRGNCELGCECVCDRAPEEYYLQAVRIAGSAPDNPDGGSENGISALTADPTKTPYRGVDCSITCPGFDGWSVKNICSGRGTCGDRGQCICDYGYVGDNCQFKCPGFDESGGKICGKKGSCGLVDISTESYRISDQRNKFRFLGTLKNYYSHCNNKFGASKLSWAVQCQRNNCIDNGFKRFVGESCTKDSDCHTNNCDIEGIYHGCQGLCVRSDPEIFPSKKGILIDKESRNGITEEWKEYNCPVNQDRWYDTMWLQVEGEFGSITFDGTMYIFTTEPGIVQESEERARSWCDLEESCYGMSNNTYWKFITKPLYFRHVKGGKKVWVKNPFTSNIKVFEGLNSDGNTLYGNINGPDGIDYSLSRVLPGLVNGICTIPSQQVGETPWVKRPKVSAFVQKYDEPVEDEVIGGYAYVMDWGYDSSTGLTTIRDLQAPTVKSVRECEVLPNFELRCPVCDCFADNIQGFWAGPMCTMCKRGYATKTCKKICPGYDGKNDNTMCSGNGVCNFGIEGTGRCMCGGKGGTTSNDIGLFKDQDFRPVIASQFWCNKWDNDPITCNNQAYCQHSGDVCNTLHDSDSGYYTETSREAVPVTYPIAHEYPYYFVKYREYTTFIWPTKQMLFSDYDEGIDIDTSGLTRQQGLGPVPGIEGWHRDKNAISKHYYQKTMLNPSNKYGLTYKTLYDAKQRCDANYTCEGIEVRDNIFMLVDGSLSDEKGSVVTYVKYRRGEEGCVDFHQCADSPENAKYFGVNINEGCCNRDGGMRGHGIPESMTRWLYKADNARCNNTFSINSASDNIIDGKFEFDTIEERVNAVNMICEYACTNGFPNIPDISNKIPSNDYGAILIQRIYDGCCACAANTGNRPTDASFWNIRFSAEKVAMSNAVDTRYSGEELDENDWKTWGATMEMSKWWTPRAYSTNNVAAKVNAPASFAYYTSRLEKYKENNYNQCPMGDKDLCENDCALCKSSKTGFNCASPCSECLMGGYCDNTPSSDGTTKCNCISNTLDPNAGCCPMGFSLITGSDILKRKTQISGIKAGLLIFYEQNSPPKYNDAVNYFKTPEVPSSFNSEDAAYSFLSSNESYKYLKRDQIQAGCYPCPGMFNTLSICDKETCTVEDSELTLERMWSMTTKLSEKKNDVWLLNKLKVNPRIEAIPRFFDFPFGYPNNPSSLLPYASEFSNMYMTGNRFTFACGGNRDYCKPMQRTGDLVPNADATPIFSYRLGCTLCDVKNVYSTYSEFVSVDNTEPIPGYQLGFSYSNGCAKCLPGQGGANAIKRIYEYCYPFGCNTFDFTSDRYRLFTRWINTGVKESLNGTSINYPNATQKKCNNNLDNRCKTGDSPVASFASLSWEPSLGCSYCIAGTGFGYDLDGDGTIEDSQFNSSHPNKLYVKDTNICYENTTGCEIHHVSDNIMHAYGVVSKVENLIFETGKGQVDPYLYLTENTQWPKNVFCRKCPINSFSTGSTNCKRCPLNKTTDKIGAQECFYCPLGKFYSLDRMKYDIGMTRCVTCPPGTYQDELNKQSYESGYPEGFKPLWKHDVYAKYKGCKVCPHGQFNPYYGSSKCYKCPSGTYAGDTNWDRPRITMIETCKTCAVGKYQDRPGKTYCKSCESLGNATKSLLSEPCDTQQQCERGNWSSTKCQCICPPNYIGIRCETFNPCKDYECNGGSCTVTNNQNVQCECQILDYQIKACEYIDTQNPIHFEWARFSGGNCEFMTVHKCAQRPIDTSVTPWEHFNPTLSHALKINHNKRVYKLIGNGLYTILKSSNINIKNVTCYDLECKMDYFIFSQASQYTNGTFWGDINDDVEWFFNKSSSHNPYLFQHNSFKDCHQTCTRGQYMMLSEQKFWKTVKYYENYSWWPETEVNNNKTGIEKYPFIYGPVLGHGSQYIEVKKNPTAFNTVLMDVEPNNIQCIECDTTLHTDNNNEETCKECAPGTFSYKKISCEKCIAGMYIPSPIGSKCITCSPGQYQDQETQTQCKLCPKGKYQPNSGSVSCLDCALGFYQDQEGQSSCVDCPQLTGTKHTSSKSLSDCGECSVEEDGKDPIDFDWCLGDTFSINGNPPPEVGAGVWSTCNGCCGSDWYNHRTCQYNHPKNQGYRGYNYLGCEYKNAKIFSNKCKDEFACYYEECSTVWACGGSCSKDGYEVSKTQGAVPPCGLDCLLTCKYTGCHP